MSKNTSAKQYLVPALKLMLVVGALWYLIAKDKLNLHDLKFQMDTAHLILGGAGLLLSTFLISYLRYWLLLRGGGIGLTLPETIRIGFIGSFFNTFMLGGLGGDVIKLAYVLHATHKRAEAVASVMVDRILGLLGLITLGAIALCLNWKEVLATPTLHMLSLAIVAILGTACACTITSFISLARGRKQGIVLWGVLCAAGIAGIVVAMQNGDLALFEADGITAAVLLRGRAAALIVGALVLSLACVLVVPSCQPGRRLEGVMRNRIPLGGKLMSLIQAVLLYKDSVRIILASYALSVVLQGAALGSLVLFSQALPLDPRPTPAHIFFAAPPAFVINALPLSFGGLGVGETALDSLLGMCRVGGVAVVGGASIMLMWRCWTVLLGLIGLPLYLRGKKEVDAATEEYQHEMGEKQQAGAEPSSEAEEQSPPA